LGEVRFPQVKTTPRGSFQRKAEGIYQYDSSGRYYAFFNFKGNRIKQRLGTREHPCTSLPEAKRLLAELKGSLERTDVVSSKKTLAAIVEEYRSIMVFSEGSKAYKGQYLDELKAAFPSPKKVASIKTSDMTRFIAGYEGRLGPATTNKVITVCRDVFQHAINDKAIPFTPMEGIKYQKLRTTEKRLTPTLEEFEGIVANVRSQPFSDTAKASSDLIEFMGLAGLGQGECAGLLWGHVNFRSSLITIIRKKTGKEFDVPIFPTLRPLMDRMNGERQEPRHATDPVFSVANPKVALSNACERLGYPDYTARAFRRMHITRCLELGIDPQTIAGWQGHTDGGALILKVYGRVSQAHQMAMAERLSPKITPLPSPVAIAQAGS